MTWCGRRECEPKVNVVVEQGKRGRSKGSLLLIPYIWAIIYTLYTHNFNWENENHVFNFHSIISKMKIICVWMFMIKIISYLHDFSYNISIEYSRKCKLKKIFNLTIINEESEGQTYYSNLFHRWNFHNWAENHKVFFPIFHLNWGSYGKSQYRVE